jgi:hypothetical protein
MGSRSPLQKRTRGKAQGINQLGAKQRDLLHYLSEKELAAKRSRSWTDKGVSFYRWDFLGQQPTPSQTSAITKRLQKLEFRGFLTLYSDPIMAHRPGDITHVRLTKLGKEAVRQHTKYGTSALEVEKAIAGFCYEERRHLREIRATLSSAFRTLAEDEAIRLYKEQDRLTKRIRYLEDRMRKKLESATPEQRRLMLEILRRYIQYKEAGVQREFDLPNPFRPRRRLVELFD